MRVLDDGVFRAQTAEEAREFEAMRSDEALLIAHAMRRRDEALAGEIAVELPIGGRVVVSLDPMALALLAGAARAARRRPERVTYWDNGGQTLKLDAEAVESVSETVAQYQQACFAALAQAKAEIAAGRVTRGAEIDALWPSREIDWRPA